MGVFVTEGLNVAGAVAGRRAGAASFKGRPARRTPAYLLKFALTERFLLIVTVQLGTKPTHAPLQLEKARPGGGVAISVTAAPAA